jgi:hypothetical protein
MPEQLNLRLILSTILLIVFSASLLPEEEFSTHPEKGVLKPGTTHSFILFQPELNSGEPLSRWLCFGESEQDTRKVLDRIGFPVGPDAVNGYLEKDSVIIPLKRAGRLFLIDARVDDETGNLIFDSGADDVVLNSTYFRKFIPAGKVDSKGITGDVGVVEQVIVPKIEFADLEYRNITVHLADLGHIENRKGVKILGLFGFNLLRKYEIIIDPVNNELKLYRIDRNGQKTNGNIPDFENDYVQKIEGSGNIVFLNGTVGGKLLHFCFDTAAETNVISSNSGKPVLNTLTITRRTTLKGAGSSTSEVLFGRMNDFELGTRKIGNMETVISNLYSLNEAYNTHIDGILGGSFLEHGIVCVNFMKSQVGIRFLKGEKK